METNPQLADTTIQSNQKHNHHHHHYNSHSQYQPQPQHHHYLRHQHNRKQQQIQQRNPYQQSATTSTISSIATTASSSTNTLTSSSSAPVTTRLQKQQTKDYLGAEDAGGCPGFNSESGAGLASGFDVQPHSSSNSMAYQHKHALHRLRRLKKRAPHRDLVISFVPRLRTSIINRLDFFNRYSKQEQEVLSCFDFLDELVLTYCDGGTESPRYSQKLYQSMINELIDSV